MALYRQHRGFLADSMETVREVSSLDDILAIESDAGIEAGQIQCEPYAYDSRIGWDTYIVTADGYGVLGFSNGPLSRS